MDGEKVKFKQINFICFPSICCYHKWKINLLILGKGLGRNEDGISAALKPKLKFDNAGVGHEQGKELTNNWWEKVYGEALNNVEV